MKSRDTHNRNETKNVMQKDQSTPTELPSKGNHSQPLQMKISRTKALAEQSKLQQDPDALPVAGYPVNRPAASPTANTEDAKLIALAGQNKSSASVSKSIKPVHKIIANNAIGASNAEKSKKDCGLA